jgi:hypothetical protein
MLGIATATDVSFAYYGNAVALFIGASLMAESLEGTKCSASWDIPVQNVQPVEIFQCQNI